MTAVTQHEDGKRLEPDMTVAQARETVKRVWSAHFDFRTSAHYSKRLFVLGNRWRPGKRRVYAEE